MCGVKPTFLSTLPSLFGMCFNIERRNDERKKPSKRHSLSARFPMEGPAHVLVHLNLTVNRCGSLVFDVVLKFAINVAEDDIISIIKSAIVDGEFGEISMNASYVIGIPPVEQTAITARTSFTPKFDGLFQILIHSGSIDVSACYFLQLLI